MRVPYLVLVVLLAGCASAEPPPFRTTTDPETPAVLGRTRALFAVSQGDAVCNPLRTVASGSDGFCLPYRHRVGLDWQSGVVPEGPRSLLMMESQRGATPKDAQTVTLIRATCMSALPDCQPRHERLATWNVAPLGNPYRKPMAISPDGRWLATVPESHLVRFERGALRRPPGIRFTDARTAGELVLVDLRSGEQRSLHVDILDQQPLSWSADGRRLQFVRAELATDLSPALAATVQGNEGDSGQGIPVVETRDVETGATEMLAIGIAPQWSPDGRTLLYKVADDALALRDAATGRSRPVALPGMTGRFGPIAFVGPRQVLYWSLPGAGTDPASTVRNSPLVGPKQMLALKVVDIDTLEVATAFPRVDPRANVGIRYD